MPANEAGVVWFAVARDHPVRDIVASRPSSTRRGMVTASHEDVARSAGVVWFFGETTPSATVSRPAPP